MAKYIMALDAGTSSSRCILFNEKCEMISVSQKEFTQYYPKPGWVEHNPKEIWDTQLFVCKDAMAKIGASYEDIAAIGITNQRETTIIWDKETGEPVYNAIVWQCRRTSAFCDELKSKLLIEIIKERTGLVLDAYFSATKIRWILDNVPGAADKAKEGELLFGTIDTWLMWKLSNGAIHKTDYSNASRTMLYNIKELKWDDDLINLLDIPKNILPEVTNSSGLFGYTDPSLFGGPIPITGVAGDQQSALFGQACFNPGDAKNTYGTGCFTLMNIGNDIKLSDNGLVTTIAWGIDGKITYALEGSVYIAGAAIAWLKDEVNLIDSYKENDELCMSVEDTDGCYVVPAFTGLAAPYWNQNARGCIVGLTRGTNRAHLVRATNESLAYQTADLLTAMEKDSGVKLSSLKVDGGASKNNFLMQFQADIIDGTLERPKCVETTAMGAAYLAGLSVGYWESTNDVINNRQIEKSFAPSMDEAKRNELLSGWKKAVTRSFDWE